jgi:hypothetical protein
MGAVAAVALALLSGCSWFLPHPEKASNVIGDADTPEDGRCSLAVAQNRKSLTGQIIADGVPKPLIIHVQSPSAAMRAVRFGQSIYFDPSTSDADRDSKPPRSIAGHAIWRIESAQDPSTEVAEEAVLTGGSTFLLRDPSASGYLRLASKATSVAVTAVTAVTRAEASRFVILKADVPDSTRPTTCDEQIRDEDFVFVRILAPSTWVNVAAAGNLEVKPTPAGMRPAPGGSNTNPLCAREEERCHTDSRGGLVCAWAPVCGD